MSVLLVRLDYVNHNILSYLIVTYSLNVVDMGGGGRVLIEILCSYVTLPLYALVTQMGSTMKPTIFNERVAAALRNWHHTAKKHVKQSKNSLLTTPMSSRPATPSRGGTSPLHLLRHYRSDMDSLQTSPRRSNVDWETDGSPSPSHPQFGEGSSSSHNNQFHHGTTTSLSLLENDKDINDPGTSSSQPVPEPHHHRIDVVPKEFSFDKRATT